MNVSEEELIYNYRLGREEALDFLFSIYEKKVAPFYKKFEYVFRINGYDYEDRKSFSRRCLLMAVKAYDFSKGNLNNFYSAIAEREIANLYRRMKNTSEEAMYLNSISLSDVSVEEKITYPHDYYDQHDLTLILDKIKTIGEKDYNIIKLYLAGNTYVEIAKKLNLKPKSISNYLQKIRRKLKKMEL